MLCVIGLLKCGLCSLLFREHVCGDNVSVLIHLICDEEHTFRDALAVGLAHEVYDIAVANQALASNRTDKNQLTSIIDICHAIVENRVLGIFPKITLRKDRRSILFVEANVSLLGDKAIRASFAYRLNPSPRHVTAGSTAHHHDGHNQSSNNTKQFFHRNTPFIFC